MKRLSLFLLAWGLLATQGITQDEERPGRERIQAMKVAFITDRLGLTPEEAQKFWPVYNEYEAGEKSIRRQYRPGKRLELLTEAEAERALEDNLVMEEKLLELKRQYLRRFREVLPARKIVLLRMAEEEFKRELLRRLRGNR